MKFQVGDRVILLEHTKWIKGDNNPSEDTEYFCEGTVTSSYGGCLEVDWDNGRNNSYNERDGDLELANEEVLI